MPVVVAVTGASGSVGRPLVPLLIRAGFTPILFGRNKQALQSLFPDQLVYDNVELGHRLDTCSAVLHLATINNDDDKSTAEEMRKVNVEWPVTLAHQARTAGVHRFIYLSSTHALEPRIGSQYALNKREASRLLNRVEGLVISQIIAPKIYEDQRSRSLATVWRILGAIKPTVSTSKLCEVICEELNDPTSQSRSRIISKEVKRPLAYPAFTTALDIGFALSIIIIFGWLLLFIGLAIRLTSPGPALFRQIRVGKNKREFVCWKFRTMHVGSVHRATHEMSSSSITGLGAVLRRTKLDELPQILNLLRRDLALIGPRPCLPNQCELIRERDLRGVFNVRPGISGYAQVNDVDMSDPRRLSIWDERYCALRSIAFDLRILVQTFLGRGRGDRISS